MTLKDLRWRLCGWTRQEAARRLGVTTRTITNWETGRHAAPPYVADYYRLASGWAPRWAPSWDGWQISADGLIGPDGWCYRPNEIQHARWMVNQLRRKSHQARGEVRSLVSHTARETAHGAADSADPADARTNDGRPTAGTAGEYRRSVA